MEGHRIGREVLTEKAVVEKIRRQRSVLEAVPPTASRGLANSRPPADDSAKQWRPSVFVLGQVGRKLLECDVHFVGQ